jgi:hypothetical protein
MHEDAPSIILDMRRSQDRGNNLLSPGDSFGEMFQLRRDNQENLPEINNRSLRNRHPVAYENKNIDEQSSSFGSATKELS